jgi:hypothetical protein
MYFYGTVVSYNTIATPSDQRISLVQNLLNDGNIGKENINLQKIFSWRCLDIGVGTDGVKCSDPKDKWWQNSIVFIKATFQSYLNK